MPFKHTLPLFSFALFLSAALMFGLQPMLGKMLLPIVGGTPAGWIVAMAFFQLMLLAGYFLAHALSRFTPRVQGVIYLLCLGAGLFFLPPVLSANTGLISDTPGAFDVFKLLTIVIAVPFIALSATASTLQQLFTTTGHRSAKDPYFLYAASNLGSFAGLLLYPFVIEPRLTLTAQSQGWFMGYIVLIGLAALCLMLSKAVPKVKQVQTAGTAGPITGKRRLEWLLLAFFPSSVMMALTTHITTNIFSAPMIWILPLGLYLFTFVVAFGRKKSISYETVLILQPIAVACALPLIYTLTPELKVSPLSMLWQLFTFTMIALMCHMRLAASRPAHEDRQLTEFYFMMALGGALGGVLNAFIIPAALDRLLEYPLMLALSCLLHPAFKNKISRKQLILLLGCAVGFAVYMILGMGAAGAMRPYIQEGHRYMFIACDVIAILLMLLLCFQPRTVFIGAAVIIFIAELILPGKVLVMHRNFYGIVKIFDVPYQIGDQVYKARYMYHGTTTHGFQILDKKYERSPTSYFTAAGPVGEMFSTYHPKKVAVLGLGTGSMNCFSTPKSAFTFFEIDPAVVKVARENYTFLSACKAGKDPQVIVGDGRLELAKLKGKKFDLIILDAFSSDTIPTHLLTAEALQLYIDHLEKDGRLLFNISNRYFNLKDTLIATGRSLGLQGRYTLNMAEDDPLGAPSRWVALARQDTSLRALEAAGWTSEQPSEDLRPWTDDSSNLLGTLQF